MRWSPADLRLSLQQLATARHGGQTACLHVARLAYHESSCEPARHCLLLSHPQLSSRHRTPACAVTYLALCHDSYSHATSRQVLQAAVVTAGCWAALFAAKLLLGYLLKQASASYVRHYERRRGAYKGVVSRRSTMAGLPTFPATPALTKKEE